MSTPEMEPNPISAKDFPVFRGKIHHVLFDLDGTLADTAPDLADTLNQLLIENGRSPMPFETIRPTVSHGGVFMINAAFGLAENDHGFAELRARFLDIYTARLTKKTRLFQGMDEVLDRFDSAGVTWGIVTNKSEKLTHPLMRALGLHHRTSCIVAGDTVGFNKPHPAPMLHACSLLGCDPAETLYIGDAERDIQAGNNTGMFTLIAGYGYIGDNDAPETWRADGMVKAPREIPEWMDNFGI
jgi:N-acetyl-D-muramate 6-phosphate phosphatase